MDISQYGQFLNCLFTDDIYLYEPIKVKDNFGGIETTWNTPVKVVGNVQNYSGELALKEYGLTLNCQDRIFLPSNTEVHEGWGISFVSVDEPALFVTYAPSLLKTHRVILAGDTYGV